MNTLSFSGFIIGLSASFGFGFFPVASAQGAHDFAEITRPYATARTNNNSAVSSPGFGGTALNSGGRLSESYICAAYDVKNERCLAREMTEEQRNSAINTGVEVANSMMQIQQEALKRAGSMNGLLTQGMVPKKTIAENGHIPTRPADPTEFFDRDSLRKCIDAELTKISQLRNTSPTAAQQLTAFKVCGK